MSIVEKSFKNGEVIVKEGEAGNSFFKLMEGEAFVYAGFGKNDQIKLSVLGTGEYFGEMAILEEYPRSATVVAKGSVSVIEIPGGELGAYLAEDPDRIIELMIYLGNRVWNMTKDYSEAETLLAQLRASDAEKKKSLFTKIKKHIDLYQSNKGQITEPAADPFREIFANLPERYSGDTATFARGDIIINEGDIDNCLYIVRDGQVGLYQNLGSSSEVKLGELKAVSVFGQLGILSEDSGSATSVVEADGTFIERISQEDVNYIFNYCPDKINAILRLLSYRLRNLNVDFLKACKEITELYGD
ncbi:MAG: cyclic nucleotide-binding domain-containing protein [Clostridiales bacterium]|nr:cyclic nucleotide-binding domain-containing protein [Clostridiales bacterium]